MVFPRVYARMKMVKKKIQKLQSFEQILAEELGYTVETYGKWHSPR